MWGQGYHNTLKIILETRTDRNKTYVQTIICQAEEDAKELSTRPLVVGKSHASWGNSHLYKKYQCASLGRTFHPRIQLHTLHPVLPKWPTPSPLLIFFPSKILCAHECLACMYICTLCTSSTHRGQRKVTDSLELWAAMWVLRAQCLTSRRAASGLNY